MEAHKAHEVVVPAASSLGLAEIRTGLPGLRMCGPRPWANVES
jgi:hypothetical protein